MRKQVLILLLSLYVYNAWAGYVCGKYTGNGGASKSITGVGYSPACLLVKGAGNHTAWIATSTMTAGYAKLTTGTATVATGYINSLDADGFTVGNSSQSNSNGVEYHFVAWDESTVDVGTFTPNQSEAAWNSATWYNIGDMASSGGHNYTSILGHSNHVPPNATYWTDNGATSVFSTSITTGAGTYTPAMVFAIGEGSQWYNVTPAQFTLDGGNSGSAWGFNFGSSLLGSNEIVDNLSSSGFTTAAVQTGTSNSTGVHNLTKYHWVSFIPSSDISSSTYVGNGNWGNAIATSVWPEFVMVKNFAGGENAWFKTGSMGPDTSYKFTDVADTGNIKYLTGNGFKLGTGGETNGNAKTFQYFAMGGGTTLPVKLTYFYGEKKLSSVQLFWQTAVEINSDYFMVERSFDGLNFEPIGLVASAGNSSSLIDYEFVDENPNAGLNYYRLKQIDNDGQYALFHVVVVDFNDGTSLTRVEVFPTEAEELTHIVLISKKTGDFFVQIFDQTGKAMYASRYPLNEGVNNLNLPVFNFPTGYYSVNITSSMDSQVFRKRFFKK